MAELPIPYISPSVVDYLERTFPLCNFLDQHTLDDFHFYRGVQELIIHMRTISDRQTKEDM